MIFSCNPPLADSNLPSLNTLRVQNKDRINIKTPSDIHDCGIIAMDITPDDRILLADYMNNSIKLFDKDGHHLASLVVANSPSDISAMSNGEAVVAFSTKTPLLWLNIKKCIKHDQSIENSSYAK